MAADVAPAAKAIASVLAGVKLAQLQEAYPDRPVVRLMPNLPVAQVQGVIAIFSEDGDINDLPEVRQLMASLGTREAINLDGGGSASLVCDGRLLNRPREQDGTEIPGGRPVVTALALTPA